MPDQESNLYCLSSIDIQKHGGDEKHTFLDSFFPPTFQHYLNVLSAVSAFKSIDFKDLIRFLGGKSNRFANTPRRKIKRGNKMCVCDSYPTGILISITSPPPMSLTCLTFLPLIGFSPLVGRTTCTE